MHMHKIFEINRIKIKGGCKSGIKAVTHNSKSDLPLAGYILHLGIYFLSTDFLFIFFQFFKGLFFNKSFDWFI